MQKSTASASEETSQSKRTLHSKAESSKSAKEKIENSATFLVQATKSTLANNVSDQPIIPISFSFPSMTPMLNHKCSRTTYSWGLEMFLNVMRVVHYLIRLMRRSTCFAEKKKIAGQSQKKIQLWSNGAWENAHFIIVLSFLVC